MKKAFLTLLLSLGFLTLHAESAHAIARCGFAGAAQPVIPVALTCAGVGGDCSSEPMPMTPPRTHSVYFFFDEERSEFYFIDYRNIRSGTFRFAQKNPILEAVFLAGTVSMTALLLFSLYRRRRKPKPARTEDISSAMNEIEASLSEDELARKIDALER